MISPMAYWILWYQWGALISRKDYLLTHWCYKQFFGKDRSHPQNQTFFRKRENKSLASIRKKLICHRQESTVKKIFHRLISLMCRPCRDDGVGIPRGVKGVLYR